MTYLPASILALPFLLATGAQTAAPTPPTGMAVFRNDVLRLSYSVPTRFVDASSLVGPALQASLGGGALDANAARCISLPLARMAAPQGQQGLAMVLLVRADGACFKKRFDARSVTELTEGEARGITASGAKARFSEVQNFTVAGRPASVLGGNFALPTGQVLQARVTCVLDQPDIACWQFLASNAAELDTMSTYPVTFDGGGPAALTPSEHTKAGIGSGSGN